MAKRYKDNPEAMNFLPQIIIKKVVAIGAKNGNGLPILTFLCLMPKRSLPISYHWLNKDIQEGDILISASYADKGHSQLPSFTKMENYVLRNPLIKLETNS